MLTENRTLAVLGASGFIGREVARHAVASGWHVEGLARSEAAAIAVAETGATPFLGDAEDPQAWIHAVRNAHAIVDLLQPKLPKRLGSGALREIALARKRYTEKLLRALESVPPAERPILISQSGIEDLAPDTNGCLSADSALRERGDYGFSAIGIPVRKTIESSGIAAAFEYHGTVYGPGKAFADTIFPSIAAGSWKNFGKPEDTMAVVHVEDVARGLVHLTGGGAEKLAGRSFVLADGCATGQNAFFDLAAACVGVPAPGHVPRWIAELIAGRPMIEAITCNVPVAFSPENFPDGRLTYASFRAGLPATLEKLGYASVRPS